MMEADAQRQLQDDQISGHPSFGSNCRPSSQSRKISIGVTVDSSAKRSKSDRFQELEVPTADGYNFRGSTQTKGKGKGEPAVLNKKQSEAPEQVNSPWICTESSKPRLLLMDDEHATTKVSSSPKSCGRQNRVNGLKESQAAHTAKVFTNQAEISNSGASRRKPDEDYHCVEGRKDFAKERSEFAFASILEVRVTDEGLGANASKTENRSEMLKMKLWEILGAASSPNDQRSKSQSHEHRTKDLKASQNSAPKKDRRVKERLNSDTIESDSEGHEGPVATLRGPITRSLTKKRARSKVQLNKTKNNTPLIYQLNSQDDKIMNAPGNGGSSTSVRKKSEKRRFRIEPRKIFFPRKDEVDKVEQAACSTKKPSPDKRNSSVKDKAADFRGCQPAKEKDGVASWRKTQKQEVCRSNPEEKTELPDNYNTPEAAEKREDIGNPAPRDDMDSFDHFPSPTLRINIPVSSSPGSTPIAEEMIHGSSNPGLDERIFAKGDPCRFWNNSDISSNGNSFDNGEKHEEYTSGKELSSTRGGEAEDGFSESSYEERDSGSSEEGLSQRQTFSPKTAPDKKLKCTPNPPEGLRSHENNAYFFSPEGSWMEEPSQPKDELERAVELFALELVRLQSRVKSMAVRKSSEILMSAAEGIYLQLQNAESQIQAELGKLISLGKSKRKYLEARFAEQKEQLKSIHEKFKEEVNRHLQNCRSTLEGLETQRIEFKGAVEKQKAAHRSVLIQVEEEVGEQLNDAERRVTAVHELARGKMQKLKNAIALCLKEDILN